ncbi:T9SS type A sorting domain-containing protein [Mucilaginibacter polytrichastri]|uniref:Secretion system C-terminal sorting domain-containing protein n=1 Tax=Mucilaginibacter polytrichastri TaxID=1302689 RepID=A0A1Q6A5A0_9SPHI|nr:T9SS type A sorting domain-containing protein [Mucilaginibacter polytrichastri]OKS89176.1 hypothetical protein RG47T_4658 [Mucilaginibacter polytrichastri]SFS97516.1 Por secretion system C-terminal sorting domain-containing protein [Mucilaginibacter polytrichastri]
MNIKNLTTRPGFEFVFAIGIAAIFILPAAVMAQDNKNIEISITNGDTVINGKNIKDLSPQDRKEALSDLHKLQGGDRGGHKEYRFERRSNGGNMGRDNSELGYSNLNIVRTPDGYMVSKEKDDAGQHPHLRRVKVTDVIITAPEHPMNAPDENRGDENRSFGPPPHDELIENFSRRNTQEFDYTNIDNDGVETGVNFRVTEPKGVRLKGIAGIDKTDLNISDLKIVPDFVTGKTLIMFSLPTKATAEIEFFDNAGKLLWSEKTSTGSFTKNFALPLNGVYNLKIKQSGKMEVKQIFKEG